MVLLAPLSIPSHITSSSSLPHFLLLSPCNWVFFCPALRFPLFLSFWLINLHLLCFQTQLCGDKVCATMSWDTTSTPCALSGMTTQPDVSQPAGGCTDSPTASVSTKLSGQRTYLQSLDRSSRAWLLSSGKSQASEEVCGLQEESGSNIWYNPIPEEEDAGGLHRKEEIWRRWDEKEEDGATTMVGPGHVRAESASLWVEPIEGDYALDGANPSVSHHVDDIKAENTGNVLIPPADITLTFTLSSPSTCLHFQTLLPLTPALPPRRKGACRAV